LTKLQTKIAVISDIHANADALAMVLAELKSKDLDLTICLGDVLTYGCQPQEVIDMLSEYKNGNPTVFIKGNHDQFYFNLQTGIKTFSYKIPEFVEESVNWTLKLISPLLLTEIFTWHDNYCIGDVYFSHANPFKYGNWSYIEKNEDVHRAFQELGKKKYFAGVFGHSHRQLFIGSKKNSLCEMEAYSSVVNKIDQLIINTGSVGQPRGSGLGYLLLEINNNKLYSADFQKITINFTNSIKLVNQAKISQETKSKIIAYFKM
jgi:predicted phosphodiesterase